MSDDQQKEIKPTKKFGSMQQQRETIEQFQTIGGGKTDMPADILTQKRQNVKALVQQPASNEEMKRQTVYIPQQLATWLKIHAATIGDDISGIITRLVEDYKDEQSATPLSVEQSSPPKAKLRAEVEAPTPLPDDLITLQAFADQHYVNRNEAERLKKTGAITAVKGTWIVGKQRVTVALDAKGRRDFWVQFHETQGFRACDDCPHSRG